MKEMLGVVRCIIADLVGVAGLRPRKSERAALCRT